MKSYPPEKWLPEIPFDVADWGDAPDPWPDGLFASDAEYEAAVKRSAALPRSSPKPPLRFSRSAT